MLKTCSSILLLSNVQSFIDYVSGVARDSEAEVNANEEWNLAYRINEDIVLCGSKYLPCINIKDYDKVRLILKTNETVAKFIQMGITHFIFDYTNVRELAFSFFVDEDRLEDNKKVTVEKLMNKAGETSFVHGSYNFNFASDEFFYEGVALYLRPSEKMYLAEWLLLQHKDNAKRITLHRLRKKFGSSFLRDVDAKGKFEERL